MTAESPSSNESPSSPTAEEQWTAVDQYFSSKLLPGDDLLESALDNSAAAGLPAISVSPNQGKFLQILAQIVGARSILEIGTLGGYSTIWLARGLRPGGRIITLEVDPNHAKVAELNVLHAGLQDVVDVRVGKALETLPQLAAEGCGPFDMIFIDADKENNIGYFQWSLKLSRAGTLIVVDNVVRDGAVIDPDSTDPRVQGVRRFIDSLGAESRASGTVIQTVGIKGYDGFAILLVEPTTQSNQH
jgi:predicted O-methyltransferase YrrM